VAGDFFDNLLWVFLWQKAAHFQIYFVLHTMSNKKIDSPNKTTKSTPEPELKWQIGPYSRLAKFKFCLPYQFLLWCKLFGVTPRQVLIEFMDDADLGSWKREGNQQVREKLIEYFIERGYGKDYYSEDEIRQIFKELDGIGMLFPEKGKMNLIDLYAKWRDKHQKYFFKKWFNKARRKM
jgi:hypothetical protein